MGGWKHAVGRSPLVCCERRGGDLVPALGFRKYIVEGVSARPIFAALLRHESSRANFDLSICCHSLSRRAESYHVWYEVERCKLWKLCRFFLIVAGNEGFFTSLVGDSLAPVCLLQNALCVFIIFRFKRRWARPGATLNAPLALGFVAPRPAIERFFFFLRFGAKKLDPGLFPNRGVPKVDGKFLCFLNLYITLRFKACGGVRPFINPWEVAFETLSEKQAGSIYVTAVVGVLIVSTFFFSVVEEVFPI